MSSQWILSKHGDMVNLSVVDSIIVQPVPGRLEESDHTEVVTVIGDVCQHRLFSGSFDECRSFLDQLANRIGAVDSRRWQVPA